MSKIIVIPEPHISSENISGRKDYINEIKGYMNEILECIVEDENIQWVSFVGDIFNRGFNNVDEYLEWVDWFISLDSLMKSRNGCVLSAVGNHELSFSKANPFWRLTSMRDGGFNTNVTWSGKSVQPKGLRSVIYVEDVFDLNDKYTLFFCHYDGIEYCKKLVEEHIEKYGDSKQRICICHNSIISSGIARTLRDNYGRDPLTHYIKYEHIDSMNLFEKFDYVFNGHMHKAYSRFVIEDSNGHKTRLIYLGSLGRTNSDEINDSDLERVCPYIDVDTDDYGGIGIELTNRRDTLVEGYDLTKVEKKVDVERYKEICSSIIDLENPVKELKDAIKDRDMSVAFECSLTGIVPPNMMNILNEVSEVRFNG